MKNQPENKEYSKDISPSSTNQSLNIPSSIPVETSKSTSSEENGFEIELRKKSKELIDEVIFNSAFELKKPSTHQNNELKFESENESDNNSIENFEANLMVFLSYLKNTNQRYISNFFFFKK
jgi:hypothetical protein